jgi:hypothetical protein
MSQTLEPTSAQTGRITRVLPETLKELGLRGPQPPPQPGRPSHRARLVVVLAVLLLCLGAIVAGVLVLLPGTPTGATITITPRFQIQHQVLTVVAVTGPPTHSQIPARIITAESQPRQSTVATTGTKQQPARAAVGTLTFYNLATYQQTVAAGTTFTGSDGVVVVTEATAYVPAGNPPTMGIISVSAQSTQTGSSGNIAPVDVNVLCNGSNGCGNGLVVKNTAAFTGGQDASTSTVVAQADIDQAATPFVAELTQTAQKALAAQVQPGEQLLPSPTCKPLIQSDPTVGARATHVTVTVQVSCQGEVYSRGQAEQLAAQQFATQSGQALGTSYFLSGQVTAIAGHAGVTDAKRGMLAIPVSVRGIWVFQISQRALLTAQGQLAGKSQQDAQAVLLHIPGVLHVTFQISGGDGTTLPDSANQIRITVVAPHP